MNKKDEQIKLIGKFEVEVIHTQAAIKDGYNLAYISEVSFYEQKMGEVYSFKKNQLSDKIQNFYSYRISNNDICVIHRFEIIESERGLGLGYKVIKDISIKFQGGCGLIIVMLTPTYLDPRVKDLTEWGKLMNFSSFWPDKLGKLREYFRKIGFKVIPGYEDYMFLDAKNQNIGLKKVFPNVYK